MYCKPRGYFPHSYFSLHVFGFGLSSEGAQRRERGRRGQCLFKRTVQCLIVWRDKTLHCPQLSVVSRSVGIRRNEQRAAKPLDLSSSLGRRSSCTEKRHLIVFRSLGGFSKIRHMYHDATSTAVTEIAK